MREQVSVTGLKRRCNRVFLAVLGFLLLTHGGHFYAVDNYTVYATARALMETGGLSIEHSIATAPGRNGREYGIYPIGLSLLQAPLISAGSLADTIFPGAFARMAGPRVSIFYPENFAVFGASLLGPLCGALAAAEFWVAAELLGYSLGVVAWLTIILVCSTQFWPAARDSFPHITVACCLLLIVCHAMTWRNLSFKPAPIRVGLAAFVLILVRPFDAVVALPAVAAYLLWQEREHALHVRKFLASNVARFLAFAAIAMGLIGLNNIVRFGDPLTFHESSGFGAPLLAGLYGLLLSPRRGIVFFSPPVLATLPGLNVLRRRRPAEAALFLALVVLYPLWYATYSVWDGGVCWGPRYLVPILPFAVLPLGELTSGGAAKALVLALGLAGLPVQLAGTLVDFQRVAVAGLMSNPAGSQILVHWRVMLAGGCLDWMALRLYAVHGLVAAIAYAAVPLITMGCASISLSRLLRSADDFQKASD